MVLKDNAYKGQRGFIIGGGPSVSSIDADIFDQLSTEIVLGINKAHKIIKPTFTVVGDKWYYNNFTEEIEKLDHPVILPSNIPLRQKKDHYIVLTRKDRRSLVLPTSLESPISFRNNAGCTAFRIAYLLGLNPIYLIGIDCRIVELKTHWHNHYTENRKPNADRLRRFYNTWVELLEEAKKNEVITYSCSVVSELNQIIDYVNLEIVLK